MYIVIVSLVIIISVVLVIICLRKDSIKYKKKLSIINEKERIFFLELKKQIPSSYYVFPKVNVDDSSVTCARSVDFLICDSYLRPAVIIKIISEMSNDMQTEEILNDAKLPLVLVDLDSDYSKPILEVKRWLCK